MEQMLSVIELLSNKLTYLQNNVAVNTTITIPIVEPLKINFEDKAL
jgi:hypothetical protein